MEHVRRTLLVMILGAAVFVVAPSPRVGAQLSPAVNRTIAVVAGASQFDLSGTGVAPVVGLRVGLPFAHVLLFEGAYLLARPAQQFGETTTLMIHEVGLQAQVPRRIAPYVGVGIGDAVDYRSEQFGGTRDDFTASVAGGVRAGLTARMGVIGELRVRGIGRRGFTAGAAEWTIGALWGI